MDLQCSKWHIGLKIEDFVFFTSILPKILPFLNLFEPPYPIYGLPSVVLVLFHLYNHFINPFMDLQYSNWKIRLKIDDFVFFTSILPNIWPFLQLQEPLQPIYALQSAYLVLFCLWNHFVCPFMDLQCSKWHIGLKMDNLLFQTPILTSILAHIALENGYKTKI